MNILQLFLVYHHIITSVQYTSTCTAIKGVLTNMTIFTISLILAKIIINWHAN